MNTTENNKNIALFLGAKVTDIQGLQKPIYYPIMGKSVYANKLNFHKDWNLLMEVVSKIFKTCDEFKEGTNNDLEWSALTREVRDAFYFPNIDNVYKAVITFIDWYNENGAKEN